MCKGGGGGAPLVTSIADKSPSYIVTLTSYGHRVSKTLPYTLYSLLNQSVQPDKIILWLDSDSWNDNNLPEILKKLIRKGIEVKYCSDIKSYKKLIPALTYYPNDILITADDDLYYPRDWFERLKTEHQNNPNAICCHRAHEITFNEEGVPLPYAQWYKCIKYVGDVNYLFPTTGGGILFPPHSLDSMVTNEKLFMTLTPNADDIWFWAMAKIKGTKYSLIKNGYSNCLIVDRKEEKRGLNATNVFNGENDTQLRNVLDYFLVNHGVDFL